MSNKELWEQVEKLIEPVGFETTASEFWGIQHDPPGLCIWEHWSSGQRIAVDVDQIWINDSSGEIEEITFNGLKSIVEMYTIDPLKAKSLPELCDDLNELNQNYGKLGTNEFFLSNKFTSLPTFGGDEPFNTEGIYSWNKDFYLVYVDGAETFKLTRRDKYEI